MQVAYKIKNYNKTKQLIVWYKILLSFACNSM